MLRNVIKSTMPVEVYYFPGEFADQKVRDEFTNEWKVTLIESNARKGDGKSWREYLRVACAGVWVAGQADCVGARPVQGGIHTLPRCA